jgi:hypothetical protein
VDSAPASAKAWASLTIGSVGAVTVDAGLNVASASYSSGDLTVNFTNAFASTNYVVLPVAMDVAAYFVLPHSRTTTSVVFRLYNPTTGGSMLWVPSGPNPLMFVVFGP